MQINNRTNNLGTDVVPSTIIDGYSPQLNTFDFYKNVFLTTTKTIRFGHAWSRLKIQYFEDGQTKEIYTEPFFITPDGTGMTWDGRDSNYDIVKNVSHIQVFYFHPQYVHTYFDWTRNNSIAIIGNKPIVPQLNISADPYTAYLSYGQKISIKYSLMQNALVEIYIKNPVTKNEYLVMSPVLQEAGQHAFVWEGLDEAGDLTKTEGHYTFSVKATNPDSGQSVVRRGNITIYR